MELGFLTRRRFWLRGWRVVDIEIHQPAIARGDDRLTWDQLQQTLADMQRDTEDESILVLAPSMSQV